MKNNQGKKYNKNLDVKEIAKLVREDIKKELPNIKTSVRIERYSMGRSINIEVIELNYNPFNKLWVKQMVKDDLITESMYIKDFQLIMDKLKEIVNNYNYNNSDGMTDYFDVNFYSNIVIEGELRERYYNAIKESAEFKVINPEVSLNEAIQEDNKGYIRHLEKKAEQGEIIRIM